MTTRGSAGAVLASALLLGGLVGCSATVEEDASSTGATSTSQSRTPAPEETGQPAEESAGDPAEAEAEAEGPAPPERVSIPALGLDEALIDLGIADTGELEVPEDPDRVGWFTGGGRPGGTGPTVIVGHVDSTTGPAVFARLPELGPGDEVEVESADGTRTTYVVDDARDVPQQPFPTEQVFGVTPDDTLRLITCTGPYDREGGRYTENRIVTATPRT